MAEQLHSLGTLAAPGRRQTLAGAGQVARDLGADDLRPAERRPLAVPAGG